MATARCANPSCSLGGTVYFAERTQGPAGKIYHKACLRCTECKKTVAPGSFQDHDGEPFCKACHGKLFGTRGYGVGHHSLVGEYRARAASPPPVLSPPRPSVTSPPPPLPLITSESTLPARRPLPTPPVRSPDPAETQLPPPTVPAKPIVPPKPTFVGAATRTPFGAAGRTSLGGGGDVCPRCKTTVYAAESVLASGSKWHKRCLRCTSCSTTLNGTNLVEKDGQPWCQKCYNKTSLAEQGLMTRPGLF